MYNALTKVDFYMTNKAYDEMMRIADYKPKDLMVIEKIRQNIQQGQVSRWDVKTLSDLLNVKPSHLSEKIKFMKDFNILKKINGLYWLNPAFFATVRRKDLMKTIHRYEKDLLSASTD
jgi:hypothetical protein